MISYFEYNGKKSSDFGIRLHNTLEFRGQNRNIEEVEVLGKDGGLLKENGYLRTFTKSLSFTVDIGSEFTGSDGSGAFDRALEISKWLKVKGWHTFRYSMYPDYEFKATITDEYNIADTIRRRGRGVINIKFFPVMYLAEQTPKNVTSGTILTNPCSRESLPKIEITATTPSLTIYNNGEIWLELKDLNGKITIDSENMIVYDDLGSATNKMIKNRPLFPVLKNGDNNITFSNTDVTSFVIYERFGEDAI